MMQLSIRSRAGLLVACVITAGLAACAAAGADSRLAADNAEQARIGSPYRWTMADADGKPARTRVVVGDAAPSRADQQMQQKILASISQAEATCGATAPSELVETRAVAHDADSVNEAWVVTRGRERVAYLVTLELGDQVDFFVHGRCSW